MLAERRAKTAIRSTPWNVNGHQSSECEDFCKYTAEPQPQAHNDMAEIDAERPAKLKTKTAPHMVLKHNFSNSSNALREIRLGMALELHTRYSKHNFWNSQLECTSRNMAQDGS